MCLNISLKIIRIIHGLTTQHFKKNGFPILRTVIQYTTVATFSCISHFRNITLSHVISTQVRKYLRLVDYENTMRISVAAVISVVNSNLFKSLNGQQHPCNCHATTVSHKISYFFLFLLSQRSAKCAFYYA